MDPIQNSSTVPLPNYQTVQGSHNPLPVNGPEQSAQDTLQATNTANANATSSFEAYLNASSITQLISDQANSEYDTAQAIRNSSVYKDPGQSTPI